VHELRKRAKLWQRTVDFGNDVNKVTFLFCFRLSWNSIARCFDRSTSIDTFGVSVPGRLRLDWDCDDAHSKLDKSGLRSQSKDEEV
jgi:hypothetical protein